MIDQTTGLRGHGLELHDIKPWQVGGDTKDPANKIFVTREKHMALVRFWNRFIRDELERQKAVGGSSREEELDI